MGDGVGSALLVIDMLNDFVLPGAPLEVPAARAIIPAIGRRVREAREAGIPVIYLCDAHAEDDPEFMAWPPHAVKGSDGARVIDQLRPETEDIVVEKAAYSAFFGTRLEEVLRGLKTAKITITGLLTNICVYYTSVDAVMRGFSVEVARDGTAALTRQEHEFALEQMEKVLKVTLI
jgi:nicotinamidase/pyrazinamidase